MQDLIGGAPKPTAHVLNASIRGISPENVVLLFDIEVENPYATGLPLIDLGYSLTSGGRRFLEGTMQPAGSIPAGGKQVIQLPATVKLSSLLGTLKGVRPGDVVPYTAEFKLGVDAPLVGRLDVPLSKRGEVPVPAVPRVDLASLDIGKLTADRITATAKLQVKNINRFPLELTKLAVSFALGGRDVGGSRLTRPLALAAGQTTTIDVPLSFSPRTAGMGLVNLLRGDQIAYQVAGSIDAGSRFGPFSMPFSHIGNTAVVK
jgi:LEA14-like dessication related protein